VICVDAIGIGSSALDFIKGLGLNVFPVINSEASASMDKAGQLHFRNLRAESYWRLREAQAPIGLGAQVAKVQLAGLVH